MRKILFMLTSIILFLPACSPRHIAWDWSEEWIVIKAKRYEVLGPTFSEYAINPATMEIKEDLHWRFGLSPEWSPDNNWIASYQELEKKGKWNSYLQLMDASNGRYLDMAELTGYDPSWSPDGSMIAYSNDGDIYILDVTCLLAGEKCTPEPIELTSGYNPDWSPDQSQIVYDYEGMIFFIDSKGNGGPQRLDLEMTFCVEPEWSPDGTQVAISCSKREFFLNIDEADVYIISSEIAEFDNVRCIGNGVSPHWSPDGSRIAIISIRDGGGNWIDSDTQVRGVFLVDLSSDNVMRLSLVYDESVHSISWLH